MSFDTKPSAGAETVDEGQVWLSTQHEPPPENVEVIAISEGGLQYRMKRVGALYLFSGQSFYAYWTPILWRPME